MLSQKIASFFFIMLEPIIALGDCSAARLALVCGVVTWNTLSTVWLSYWREVQADMGERSQSVVPKRVKRFRSHHALILGRRRHECDNILSAKGRDVATIEPTATVADAAKILAERKIGALVVTGADGRVIGIVSERDIVRALASTAPAALDCR